MCKISYKGIKTGLSILSMNLPRFSPHYFHIFGLQE